MNAYTLIALLFLAVCAVHGAKASVNATNGAAPALLSGAANRSASFGATNSSVLIPTDISLPAIPTVNNATLAPDAPFNSTTTTAQEGAVSACVAQATGNLSTFPATKQLGGNRIAYLYPAGARRQDFLIKHQSF